MVLGSHFKLIEQNFPDASSFLKLYEQLAADIQPITDELNQLTSEEDLALEV